MQLKKETRRVSLHVFSPEVSVHFRVPLLIFKLISVLVCHFNRK